MTKHTQTFIFPIPPPINQTYRAVYSSRLKRTVFFSSYPSKKWKKEAQEIIREKTNRFRSIYRFIEDEAVFVEIKWYLKRERDIDSGIKLVLDAFEGEVFKNDSQIKRLLIIKEFDKENPRVEARIALDSSLPSVLLSY